MSYWKDDSLYVHVDDIDSFILNYESFLNNGTYNNLKSGTVDFFGINYYTTYDIGQLIDVISKKKPFDYEKLVSWLKEALQYMDFIC